MSISLQAKIRFLKAASKIISFIATNYMFKHNNSNILIHLGFSREWCNHTNRIPYINIKYCLQISSEMQCIFKKYTPT